MSRKSASQYLVPAAVLGVVIMGFGCSRQDSTSLVDADLTVMTYNVQRPETDSIKGFLNKAQRAAATVNTIVEDTAGSPAIAIFSQESYTDFSDLMAQHFQRVSVSSDNAGTLSKLAKSAANGRLAGVNTEIFIDQNSEIVDNTFLPFSHQGSGADRVRTSGMQEATISDVDGRQRILVNTQLPSLDADARGDAMNEMIAEVQSLRQLHPNIDILLGGDFNDATDSTGGLRAQMQAIGALAPADSTATWDNEANTRTHGDAPGTTARLDDIFVMPGSSGVAITDSQVVKNTRNSDHFALLAHVSDPDADAATSGEADESAPAGAASDANGESSADTTASAS